MTKTFFNLISYLLHPAMITVAGVAVILNYSHLALLPFDAKKAIFTIVALTTLFFPLAIIPIFYYQKIISGVTLSNRNERLLPIFLAAAFYYFGYFILHKYAAPVFLQHYLLAAFICVLLAAIIHIKWKISLHMIGIGGFIGLLSVLGFLYQIQLEWLLMLSIGAAGIVGTARLYLQEHNHAQIYMGFLLGFSITFALMAIIQ